MEATNVVLCRVAREGLAGCMERVGGWFALSASTSEPDKTQTALVGETTLARVQATVEKRGAVLYYNAQVIFGVDGQTIGQLAIMNAETNGEPIAIATLRPLRSVAGRPYRLFLEVDFTV